MYNKLNWEKVDLGEMFANIDNMISLKYKMIKSLGDLKKSLLHEFIQTLEIPDQEKKHIKRYCSFDNYTEIFWSVVNHKRFPVDEKYPIFSRHFFSERPKPPTIAKLKELLNKIDPDQKHNRELAKKRNMKKITPIQ